MNTKAFRRERLRERLHLALEPEREFVLTPCIGVCHMDAKTALCEGCLRSIDEIARWGSYEDSEKRAIWSKIAQRLDSV